MDNTIYNDKFHELREQITKYSASFILNILKNVYSINCLCDIGGGIGVWTNEFKKNNQNAKILCVDGFYIKEEQLLIDIKDFLPADLEKK